MFSKVHARLNHPFATGARSFLAEIKQKKECCRELDSLTKLFDSIDGVLNFLACDPGSLAKLGETRRRAALKPGSITKLHKAAKDRNVDNPIIRANLFTHPCFRKIELETLGEDLQDPTKCQNVSDAIIQANFFNQSYFKEIKLEELEEELQDSEKGIFLINVTGSEFVNEDNQKKVFQGHSFTIIKVVEGQRMGYRLAQSYVKRYDLADFLARKEKYFYDFASLEKEILDPLQSLLHKKGPWTDKECQNYYALTSVDPELTGFFPDIKKSYAGSLLSNAAFGRTTDRKALSDFQGASAQDSSIEPIVVDQEAKAGPQVTEILLTKRFDFIDRGLKFLASHPAYMARLAEVHRGFVLHSNSIVELHETATSRNVSYAVTQANFFNHSYFKKIRPEELNDELQDGEEGTFLLELYESQLINEDNQKKIFPGHNFVIIKVIEGQKMGYRLVQSYVRKYDLADFLARKEIRFYDFASLEKEILGPLYALLHKKGPWTDKECQNYYSIASVYPHELIGFFPNVKKIYAESLLANASFGRTTEKSTREEAFPLIKFRNGIIVFPSG